MFIDFYFDFLSPFSYLANHRLSNLAREYNISIRYHAVDLAKLKRAIGNIGPSNRDLKVKLEYLKLDLQRWAEIYEIPLKFPSDFNSHRMNAGLYYSGAKAQVADYVGAVFKEVWGEGVSPDSEILPERISKKLGWSSENFLEFLNSEDSIKAYDDETEAAIDRKVFGVPTMCIEDEMWWGNDRLFMVQKVIGNICKAPVLTGA